MSENRNVLVTGGAGFIGSHTCKMLKRLHYTPIVFDNLSTGDRRNVRFGPLIEADALDQSAVESVLDRWRPIAVIHFAASAYVGESNIDPGKYYQNNVGSMVSVLRAMVDRKVSNMIFSSSCATYGVPSALPITEDTPQNPINPYGRSKLFCEEIIKDFSVAHGLSFCSLRYFNAAGADSDGELYEIHDPETHLIPNALRAASGRGARLKVFGDDYDTEDGSCVRDYIHVDDLAEGHTKALEYLLAGHVSQCFNLGSGKAYSIFEILNRIERLSGRSVPRDVCARRPGDPPVLCADVQLAQSKLDFRASRSDIDHIIATAMPGQGLRSKIKGAS